MNFKDGQILAYQSNNRYGLCKVLQITEGEKEEIISVVVYRNRFDELPERVDLDELSPFIIHVPISLAGMLKSNFQEVGYQEVSEEELKGYSNWFEHWKNGQAGFFPVGINNCVDYIVETKLDVQDKDPKEGSAARAFREKMQGGQGFPF